MISERRKDRGSPPLVAALLRLAPTLILALFAISTLAVVLAAGDTLGYDYQAYARAAGRLLAGQPLYDHAVDLAGGFAIYLYPPPFALGVIPFAVLPDPLGACAWLAVLAGAFLVGAAALPVRPGVRWAIVGLAAVSWPFLYSVKLGQVGPLLFLAFSVGWRCLDRPGALGLAVAAGALVKVQPALLFGWMLVTRRWRALTVGLAACAVAAVGATLVTGLATWADYAELLGRVSQPVTTPKNMTPGAVAYRAGLSAEVASAIQLAAMAVTAAVTLYAWLRRDAATGFIVGVVASQLLSPLLWEHYAMLLLVPVALLLERRRWWAAALLPALWIPADLLYPLAFGVGLLAPLITAPRSLAPRRA